MNDELLWMENLNDERVIKFIDEENKRTGEFLGDLPSKIKEEIEKYFYIPILLKVKISKNGYFKLYRMMDEFTIFRDDIIIVSSKDLGENVILQDFHVNDEGDMLAYTYSQGTDEGITKIVDLKSNEIIDELRGIVGHFIWLGRNKYYYTRFYTRGKTIDGVDAPAERVFLRENKEEKMVFGEGLPQSYFISMKKSNDGKYALIEVSYGWNKSDIYFGSLDSPGDWKRVYGGDFVCHPVDYIGDLYILSYEKDGMGKIITLKKGVIIEEKYPIEDAIISGGKIIVNYLKDASSYLKFFDLKGNFLGDFIPNLPGTFRLLDSKNDESLILYTSFTIPYILYSLKGELKILEERKIPRDYEIREEWAKSRDGTKIHMFKVGKENCYRALVYGYGGFGISMSPIFYPNIIPLIERGGCFVMTNLRGGGEYGEKWHRAGMREKKQNVFDDFISCLEKLKDEGMKVVAWGGSNGGLLVSTVLTQKPESMDGAVIGYPVIDMLRFHKLYIGSVWIPEYGNPDSEDREFLIKYSPYHNIRNLKYPTTLIYTGLHDDRVHPSHALKFARKLRDLNSPVYLRVEMESGHIGASQKIKIKEFSDIMAFIFKILSL